MTGSSNDDRAINSLGSTACRCVYILPDHDDHHVQDCSGKTSSQLYHSSPSTEFGSKTPPGGHHNRETRPPVVRPWLHKNCSDSNPPFSVFRDSVQIWANPQRLCEHGPTVKEKTSGYVQPTSYQSHVAINWGILGYILRMLKPTKPLGFITRIFRFPHCAH